jgi:hypothetical protein
MQPALLGPAHGMACCREVAGRKHASGRLRRAGVASELLRARQRPARRDPDQPGLHPRAIAPILPQLPFLQVVDQVLDGSGAGAVVGPPGSGVSAASIQRIEGKEWSVFGGRWRESEYFFTPIPLGPIPAGALPIGLAPASPANQQNWLAETVLAWPIAS